VSKEALRNDEVEIVLCPRHGDVERPTRLFELGTCTGAEVRGHTSSSRHSVGVEGGASRTLR
jgi:hypothetical protein